MLIKIKKLNWTVKRQGYYDESRELFFFHVTEEQYNELTNSFFEAYSELDIKRREVTYTYEELIEGGVMNKEREKC